MQPQERVLQIQGRPLAMFVLQIEQEGFVMSGHSYITVSVPGMQMTEALIYVIQPKAVCKRRDINWTCHRE